MVEVVARARWFAKGRRGGIGGTESTFFEDRSSPRARLDRRPFASAEPAASTYLRDGLLVLGLVAAGLLLSRRSTRGGASPSPSSEVGGTGAGATDRSAPDSAVISGSPSEPARGPADGFGGADPAPRRSAPQDVFPPAPGEPDQPIRQGPRPARGNALGPILGRAGRRGSRPGEEPHVPQEAEPPTEETPNILEELPPPPQTSDVELPTPAFRRRDAEHTRGAASPPR